MCEQGGGGEGGEGREGVGSDSKHEELEQAQSLAGHGDTVFDVAWVAPGSSAYHQGVRLVSASHDNTLRAWGIGRCSAR